MGWIVLGVAILAGLVLLLWLVLRFLGNPDNYQ
jgi:hypothetical protein